MAQFIEEAAVPDRAHSPYEQNTCPVVMHSLLLTLGRRAVISGCSQKAAGAGGSFHLLAGSSTHISKWPHEVPLKESVGIGNAQ